MTPTRSSPIYLRRRLELDLVTHGQRVRGGVPLIRRLPFAT